MKRFQNFGSRRAVLATATAFLALASADVDLLAFSEVLRSEVGVEALTFGQTLDSQVTMPQVLSALAAAAGGR